MPGGVADIRRPSFDAPSKDDKSPMESVFKYTCIDNGPFVGSSPRVDKVASDFHIFQEQAGTLVQNASCKHAELMAMRRFRFLMQAY